MHKDTVSFINLLFADMPANKFIGVLAKAVDDRNNYKLIHCNSVSDVLVEIERLQTMYDDIFVGVAPRDRKSPKKSSVTETTFVWADVDPDSNNGLESWRENTLYNIQQCVLPPTLVVDSGRGFHVYWKLVKPLVGTDKIQTVLKQATELVAGDAQVNSPEHVMRVPGTYNRKHGEERLSKIVSTGNIQIDPVLFDYFARLSQRTRRKIKTGDSRGYKSRSERDMSVVRALVAHECPDEFIYFVFENYNIGDRFKQRGGDYLKRTIEKVRGTPTTKKTKTRTPVGFFLTDDGTMAGNERNNRQVATFTYEPKYILNTQTDVHIMGDVIHRGKRTPNVAVPKDAFTRISRLMTVFHDPEWVWVGSDLDARRWLAWLMSHYRDQMTRVTGTYQIGRHGDVFVTTDSTITADSVVPNYKSDVMWVNTGKMTTRIDTQTELKHGEIQQLVDHLLNTIPVLNEPGVIWPAIGWTVAALAKPTFKDMDIPFPILNLAGTRGSGKTTLIVRVLHKLVGIVEPVTRDCNTTNFVMLALLGSTNAVPVALSEFRLSARQASYVIRKILLAYDTGYDSRGRSNQSTVDYPLSAPFSVDGEDPIVDSACQERIIALRMMPSTVAELSDSYEAFERFQTKNITGVGVPLIQSTLRSDIKELFKEAQGLIARVFPQVMPPRIRRNITVVATGLLMFREFVAHYDRQLTVDESFIRKALTPPVQNVLGESISGRTQLLVDEFVQDVIDFVMLGTAVGKFLYAYNEDTNILYIHLRSAIAMWREFRRRQDLPVLTPAAITQQIKERTQIDGEPVGTSYIIAGHARSIAGQSVWTHGIDLNVCAEIGLQTPKRLYLDDFVIHNIKPKEVVVGSQDNNSDGEEQSNSASVTDDIVKLLADASKRDSIPYTE